LRKSGHRFCGHNALTISVPAHDSTIRRNRLIAACSGAESFIAMAVTIAPEAASRHPAWRGAAEGLDTAHDPGDR
jgi:hypothetical protein